MPSPPESSEGNNYERPEPQQAMQALAFHPGLGGHQHNAALEVMANGDLLFMSYSCWTEYNPEVGFMAARLRLGEDQWEMPSIGFDLVGVNDHGPLLWSDGNQTHLFWGNPKIAAMAPRYPFQWVTTEDSGATWSSVNYPTFKTKIPPSDNTPTSTALRDRDGVIYIAADGAGADSLVWVSDDNMKTWKDMGGRTNGGHSCYALLSDGKTIFAINDRKTNIDSYMTSSTSRDGARTFTTAKTPFTWGGSNQRASILRLRSGRLLVVGDYQHATEPAPAEYRDKPGCYAAYSEDDGKTWHFKDLIGVQRHETRTHMFTVGYSALRQGRDDLIHVVTTMNEPCLHLAFNEAWLLSRETLDASDAVLMANSATTVSNVQQYEENYPNGRVHIAWSAGVGDDGRYLMEGPQRWYYPDGKLQYEAAFVRGVKRGEETLFDSQGRKLWQWNHASDGRSEWTQFWPNGKIKAQSGWKAMHADGHARRWDREGNSVSEVVFSEGKKVSPK